MLVSDINSRWRTATISQGQHWVQLMICVMRQTVSSAKLLMVQNVEDQLIDQLVMVPSRGTWTGWREWVDRNFVTVSKGSAKSCSWGRSNPRYRGYLMGSGRLESSFAEKAFGGLGDTRLNTIQQCVLTCGCRPTIFWAAVKRVLPEGQGGILPSHPDESTSYSAVPISPVRQRHEHTGKSLVALP